MIPTAKGVPVPTSVRHSRSRDKWVGATVRRVNRDGTLHIELEDGRSDHAINPKYVRHRRYREDQAATQIQGVLRGRNARADARVQRSMRAFDEMEYSDGTTQTLSRFACGSPEKSRRCRVGLPAQEPAGSGARAVAGRRRRPARADRHHQRVGRGGGPSAPAPAPLLPRAAAGLAPDGRRLHADAGKSQQTLLLLAAGKSGIG